MSISDTNESIFALRKNFTAAMIPKVDTACFSQPTSTGAARPVGRRVCDEQRRVVDQAPLRFFYSSTASTTDNDPLSPEDFRQATAAYR